MFSRPKAFSPLSGSAATPHVLEPYTFQIRSSHLFVELFTLIPPFSSFADNDNDRKLVASLFTPLLSHSLFLLRLTATRLARDDEGTQRTTLCGARLQRHSRITLDQITLRTIHLCTATALCDRVVSGPYDPTFFLYLEVLRKPRYSNSYPSCFLPGSFTAQIGCT